MINKKTEGMYGKDTGVACAANSATTTIDHGLLERGGKISKYVWCLIMLYSLYWEFAVFWWYITSFMCNGSNLMQLFSIIVTILWRKFSRYMETLLWFVSDDYQVIYSSHSYVGRYGCSSEVQRRIHMGPSESPSFPIGKKYGGRPMDIPMEIQDTQKVVHF